MAVKMAACRSSMETSVFDRHQGRSSAVFPYTNPFLTLRRTWQRWFPRKVPVQAVVADFLELEHLA